MSPLDFLRDYSSLCVRELAVTPDLVLVAADAIESAASCPACGAGSGRVHSRYTRTVADLPWQGRRVVLRLTVRRFRCRTPGCRRAIFGERFPQVIAPYAHTTARLAGTHRAIGLALGGEAGSRLADRLAVPTSPDTILRRATAAASAAPHPTPRVLGVDDFAFRKGRTYGTILVDLERRRVVDLLPDRTADTLAEWLRSHPGVEVVSRDRASAYADAATGAVPHAAQVADRFHLLVNVREAVDQVLARHMTAVRDALADPAAEGSPDPPPSVAPAPMPDPPHVERRRQATAGRRDRRRERYDEVLRLRAGGATVRDIAAALRMSGRTVVRFLKVGPTPDRPSGQLRPSGLDPFRAYLDERLTAGCRNARTLHRELRGRGYTGGYDPVRRAVRQRTGADGRRRRCGPIRPRAELPSSRRLSFAVARRPDRRSDDERRSIECLRAASGAVSTAVDLGERFSAVVRDRSVSGRTDGLGSAAASGVPEFAGLARSMTRDLAAVRAGVAGAWSNGQVEGQVHRLKLVKRSGYGRAGFALLKARVLNTG